MGTELSVQLVSDPASSAVGELPQASLGVEPKNRSTK
jgi:hypothetical protein